jgi:hypothetical protein
MEAFSFAIAQNFYRYFCTFGFEEGSKGENGVEFMAYKIFCVIAKN